MFIFLYLLAVTGVSLLLSGCSAATPSQALDPGNISDQNSDSAPSQVPDPVNMPEQNTENVQTEIQLPHIGPAPEIAGSPWINSDPLTMPALRGQVVLLEFWTFG